MDLLASSDDLMRSKGRVVVETIVLGVRVSKVARWHDLGPNRLSSWRRLARDGKLVVPDLAGADFAPVVLDSGATPSVATPERAVEIVHGPVTIGLDGDTQPDRIAPIAHALSAGA